MMGGVWGIFFAHRGVTMLVAAVSTGSRTVPLDVTPDARVLGFTLAVSLLTGIFFGLAPALRATKVDLSSGLKGSAPGKGGRPRWGLMKSLVVAQVALSLPLLAGAGLFLRTVERLYSQDLGFS
ncbi:MAG: permease, partial [Acidobacteria bacterium]